MADPEKPRRGRPRKDKSVEPQAQQNTTSEPTPETAPAVPQIDIQEVTGSATHTFLKALYKEGLSGTPLDLAYMQLTDQLAVVPDVTYRLSIQYNLTDLVVREAVDRPDEDMQSKFTQRRIGLKTVLDQSTTTSSRSGTNPSSLGPMTGKKG